MVNIVFYSLIITREQHTVKNNTGVLTVDDIQIFAAFPFNIF